MRRTGMTGGDFHPFRVDIPSSKIDLRRRIAKGVLIPVAVSVFPGERYQAPRSWAERAYPNLIYYHQVDKGGHFAAWEQPQLPSEEIRGLLARRAAETLAVRIRSACRRCSG